VRRGRWRSIEFVETQTMAVHHRGTEITEAVSAAGIRRFDLCARQTHNSRCQCPLYLYGEKTDVPID
jgi:hypothetical protein